MPSSSRVALTSAGDRSTNRGEHSASYTSSCSFLLNARAGGRTGLLMPGGRPLTTVPRGSGDTEGVARGLHPDMLRQLFGRLHEFFPSSRLNPSSPATFPWIDDQVRLVELRLQACLLALQLAHLVLQRISLLLAAPLLGQRLQRPTPGCLAPRRQVRRVQPLPPQEPPDLSRLRALIRFFDDP